MLFPVLSSFLCAAQILANFRSCSKESVFALNLDTKVNGDTIDFTVALSSFEDILSGPVAFVASSC